MGLFRGEAVDDDRLRRPLLLFIQVLSASSDRSMVLAQPLCGPLTNCRPKLTNAIPLPAVVSLAAGMCHRAHNKCELVLYPNSIVDVIQSSPFVPGSLLRACLPRWVRRWRGESRSPIKTFSEAA